MTRQVIDATTPVHGRLLDVLIVAAVVLRVAVDWLPNPLPVPVGFTLTWLVLLALQVGIARAARGRLDELLVTGRRLRPAVLAGLATWPLWLPSPSATP